MKLPKTFFNKLSLLGTGLGITALVIFAFLFILTYFFNVGSTYLGILMYMVLPIFLIIGLILIPIGMVRTAKRFAKDDNHDPMRWKVIDFNNPRTRVASVVFVFGTLLFMVLSALGSYQAFHITESVEFCGTVCHTVMEPEHTTYQGSPHSRVTCTECHVGEGAGWYVKSKLSGAYQVYSVLAEKYPKPIPTPIENLRPARETCEQCHWPKKFYSNQLRYEKHFLADSANTEWNIHLNMKIGEGHSMFVNQKGIHWHNNENVKIEYIASDKKREYLPWIRYINLETGDTIVYEDEWVPLEDSVKAVSESRRMDCMDCHNRPSHKFLVPQLFVDQQIATGAIPKDLPEIKKVTMDILFNEQFSTKDSAFMIIEDRILAFYKDNYPEIYKQNLEKVQSAIAGTKECFGQNIFPEMGANWDEYPDHIGHMEYNGCFRCHDGFHVSSDGDRISKDCNMCHSIMLQGEPGKAEKTMHNESLEFKHPVDIGGAWKESNCSDCHRYLYN
jgi:hypothetical protein